MNSNEFNMCIISIESPRQEKAGKKTNIQLRRSVLTFFSCNLPIKLIFNLHLTHNFNNLILISLILFNFQTCSTNLWDFLQKIPQLPGPPGLKTNDGHPPVIDTECPSKSAAFRPEICTRREANIAAKCEASLKHCNMKMMNFEKYRKDDICIDIIIFTCMIVCIYNLHNIHVIMYCITVHLSITFWWYRNKTDS